jgi:hypothetical protein
VISRRPRALAAAATCTAAVQPGTVTHQPNPAIAIASPIGLLLASTATAVAISRPANQSAVILATSRFSTLAPLPQRTRPLAAPAKPVDWATMRLPAVMTARPRNVIAVSPKRAASQPVGMARTMAGSMNRPISRPASA